MNQPQPESGSWGAPAAWAQAGAPVEQPPSIRLAVRLMWVGATVTLIGIVSAFLQVDELKKQIRDSDRTLRPDEVDSYATAVLMFAVVIGSAVIGLWLWMAGTNAQGKMWARTTATVLGALNLASNLVGLALGQQAPITMVINVVNLVLAATILVLLYRPDSNRFYNQNQSSMVPWGSGQPG
ncbi:MAG TPA: hypothetical protein VGJ86_05835 [Acidimicrobiales bacterium]